MKIPIISVIMPCYNSEKYLIESINSVINQTFCNWELLIIDDSSIDNSVKIIQEYCNKDSRIKYFKTERLSGSPTIPRNIGIENAVGKYIAFLDSDDIWLPAKLEKQIALFKNEKTAIVFSNYEKMGENGKRKRRYIYAPSLVTYNILLKGNVIGCSTVIYDISKTGKMYFSTISHEDYILWLSILKKGFVAQNTDMINSLYRVRKNSVSSNKLSVLLWQWNIYINVEKTGYIKAIYYFINYAFRAFLKTIK
jgi:glycosyltransferase involved in cell wall biosynthesis